MIHGEDEQMLLVADLQQLDLKEGSHVEVDWSEQHFLHEPLYLRSEGIPGN
jgi:hypothetical protein